MTNRTDHIALVLDAVIDMRMADMEGRTEDAAAIHARLIDLVVEREDFHCREADLMSSKIYDAGTDLAVPFYGRGVV